MNFKRFSILYFVVLGVSLVCLFIFLHVLSLFFEHNLYSQIVQYQIRNNAIYGSALNENYFRYRLELIKAQKPDIVAIGSSRVGQFKKAFFNQTFVAAANGGNSLAEMQLFLEEMLKTHKPKLVILGLDPWWFNKKMPNEKTSSYQKLNGEDITTSKIFNGIKIFLENPSLLIGDIVKNQTANNPFTKIPSMGFRAVIKSDGSFLDGSYLYFSTLSGIIPAEDRLFQNSISRIQREVFPFYYGEKIEETRIKDFFSILDFLKKKQVETLVLVAPLAPTVYDLLTKDSQKRFEYISAFNDFARKNQIYNFFNPYKLETTDCEFYDGFHGGDVAYARILQHIANSSPYFAQFINLAEIEKIIRTKRGYAYSQTIQNWKEVDFLEIGCKK